MIKTNAIDKMIATRAGRHASSDARSTKKRIPARSKIHDGAKDGCIWGDVERGGSNDEEGVDHR